MGVSQNSGYRLRGPHNKDETFRGLYWGPPVLGNYPLGALVKGYVWAFEVLRG